ncbi:MAG: hypothetical protein KGV44_08390, partial [Flavobacteriaceae bacterium]|nr:hypothetical protein [Flavobacteriaceae bacterium]
LVVFLLCCLVLMETVQVSKKLYPIFKSSYKWILFSILGLIIVALLPINKTVTLWLSIACLIVPIISSLTMWVKLQSEINFQTKE